MKYLIALLILFSLPCFAGSNYVGDSSHATGLEAFNLKTDFSQQAHAATGVALTVTLHYALRKAGMKPLAATLTAMAISGLAGAAKEAMVDDYCSPNGIKSWWAGTVIGGMTVAVLNF